MCDICNSTHPYQCGWNDAINGRVNPAWVTLYAKRAMRHGGQQRKRKHVTSLGYREYLAGAADGIMWNRSGRTMSGGL